MYASNGQVKRSVYTTSDSSPVDRGVPSSSRSSASSTLCSPASSGSQRQLSSAQSSPPVDGSAASSSLTQIAEKAGAAAAAYNTSGFDIRPSQRSESRPSFSPAQANGLGEIQQPDVMTTSAAFSFTTIPEQDTASANEAGPSSAANTSMKNERHASKSRRMSPGGSRHPNDESAEDGRNGYSRSASNSGSDWLHVQKTRTTTAPNVDANGTPAEHASLPVDGKGDVGSRSPHLDLANFPPQDLLRILAALLTQIATANDQLRPTGSSEHDGPGRGENSRISAAASRNADPEMALAPSTSSRHVSSSSRGYEVEKDSELGRAGRSKPTTAAMGALNVPSSTLCFRARNIPSISIEAYLLRILRYCPASCEVFVSILIYFDRMSKMGQAHENAAQGRRSASFHKADSSEAMSRSNSDLGSSLRDSHGNQLRDLSGDSADADDAFIGMRGFAIDSFNVHRLVIAGVTVASKFFSDVFYTNSRYAKVGGLPVHELNQLELQFLLLNDFNLMIPLEEMQRYANQLLVYGSPRPENPPARLVLGDSRAPASSSSHRDANGHHSETRQRVAGDESVAPRDPLARQRDLHGDTTMASA